MLHTSQSRVQGMTRKQKQKEVSFFAHQKLHENSGPENNDCDWLLAFRFLRISTRAPT